VRARKDKWVYIWMVTLCIKTYKEYSLLLNDAYIRDVIELFLIEGICMRSVFKVVLPFINIQIN
jgi:hypothetical protein